eukprot:1120235-Prorocentrum_minimum.AAC.1
MVNSTACVWSPCSASICLIASRRLWWGGAAEWIPNMTMLLLRLVGRAGAGAGGADAGGGAGARR